MDHGDLEQRAVEQRVLGDLANAGDSPENQEIHGILAPIVHELSVSAIVDRWAEDDPRWEALIAAV